MTPPYENDFYAAPYEKRIIEEKKLKNDLDKEIERIRKALSGIDWYTINKAIGKM